MQDLSTILDPLISRVRTDVTAALGDKGMVWTKDKLTPPRITAHLNGGKARGVCPIKEGESTTMVALLDLDSHKGETSWADMAQVAQAVMNVAPLFGLEPMPWRSRGGRGIHLFFIWDEPQDAYSVRALLSKMLKELGYENGTGGVKNKQIEIFPKQDKVPVGGFGSQFILPLAGQSVPLEPLLGLEPLAREDALSVAWVSSKPVPIAERSEARRDTVSQGALSGSELARIVEHIEPNKSDDEYWRWLKVGMALHYETQGSADGLALWMSWSSKGHKYNEGTCVDKWESFRDDKEVVTTAGTLLVLAREGGYVEDVSKDFDDLVVPEAEARPVTQHVVVPDAKNFPNIARRLLKDRLEVDSITTLRYAQQDWFRYLGVRYERKEKAAMDALVRRYLDGATTFDKKGHPIPVNPNTGMINEVLGALQTETLIENCTPPMWLNGKKDVEDYIVVANGILHVPTRKLMPHTPDLFVTNALDFDWIEHPGAPSEWFRFLESVWGDDNESIEMLQEMFGYLLTTDTSQQKMFLIKGPPRSGKGTIAHVLRCLLGENNTVDTSFAQLASGFGLESLLGKTVAFLPEARNTGSKHTSIQVAVERMLSISGEDNVSVERKYQSAWLGKLNARFVMMANEVPALGDSTEAFASRFLSLKTMHSFVGREDTRLLARLLKELPQILAWALDGRDRLKARGRFVVPTASKELMAEIADANNPLRVFCRERCEFGPELEVSKDDLYGCYKYWASDGGGYVMSRNVFFGSIINTYGNIKALDTHRGGKRVFTMRGIGLRGGGDDGGDLT